MTNLVSSEEIVEELAIEKVKAYVRTRQQSDEVLDGKHAHTNVDYEVRDEMHTGLADIAVNHILGAQRFRLKIPLPLQEVFSLVQPDDVRLLINHRPDNVKTLIVKVIGANYYLSDY